MKIAVIGTGGREYAICWKLSKSPKVEKLYCIPGNGGTARVAANVKIDALDNEGIKKFCLEEKIDLVMIGPEAPLAHGLTDTLEAAGISVCGPSYAAARLEASKIFAKELMAEFGIPTAHFRVFDDYKKAEKYIMSAGAPLVIKADGLAAGKGVVVASTAEEAVKAAKEMLEEKKLGAAGNRILVEEFLKGEELSILVLTDGTTIVPLASSQDHKRVFDGDKGPNTGGMGAYSPAPVMTPELYEEVEEKILYPTLRGLKEKGVPYKGILYAGLMITDKGPMVMEYNVRFGDPEMQAVLPRMKTDVAELLMATAESDLAGKTIEWEEGACVCVVLASSGYPGNHEKGKEIYGICEAEKDGVLVFHAGTAESGGKIVTFGGRVLNVVGTGKDIKEAIDKVYAAIPKINFEGMFYRRDIGYRALERLKKSK
jgi:phosphoribosylamine--glycine ligase